MKSQVERSHLLVWKKVLAKTDVEIERLGWTPEQGREHLIKTYGKRSPSLVTDVLLRSM
ncbi:hypothetical protein [Nostoc sphaeroides]|uniref:Uncharacterized protein n=1 Tax=Nostoc sphaeroides CCNUC1 TaxID=2653204 RepID=A0A5P8VVU5_9NOSO|nr:hypothetical protein [Nostoc sphaeroides]QFS44029.1 hypothetical protein GXM_01502 [Nostoc sphaeroides CCNUC1]